MQADPLVRNNVTVAGNPDARSTIVFVCGLGTDQSVWNRIIPSFRDDYRVVTFDNVGAIPANRSTFLTHKYRYLNITGYAQDLVEVCDALKLRSHTVLVGHSLGALASLVACVQRPQLFSRLALIGASPRYVNSGDYRGGFTKTDVDMVYEALMNDYESWARHFAGLAMANPHRPELAMRFAETLKDTPKDMMLTMLCSALQTDQRDKLPGIIQPTLVI
ncbi:MAG: alpha/beta fold hydrolase [Betaproteobacteria bacterium]|nr:alpha/beta fold hydrolase [Betaproteobacteria bacterium]